MRPPANACWLRRVRAPVRNRADAAPARAVDGADYEVVAIDRMTKGAARFLIGEEIAQ
ncbi:MAG: hypothetical protein R3C42_05910 [Parvularculaceae bacterium]